MSLPAAESPSPLPMDLEVRRVANGFVVQRKATFQEWQLLEKSRQLPNDVHVFGTAEELATWLGAWGKRHEPVQQEGLQPEDEDGVAGSGGVARNYLLDEGQSVPLVQILVDGGFATSKGEARSLIRGGAVRFAGCRASEDMVVCGPTEFNVGSKMRVVVVRHRTPEQST